jgi:hypothetical protein
MMDLDINDPNFCPPGTRPFVIYRNFNNMKNCSWNANASVGNTLDFKIYDESGSLMSDQFFIAPRYSDWQMTLLASEN